MTSERGSASPEVEHSLQRPEPDLEADSLERSERQDTIIEAGAVGATTEDPSPSGDLLVGQSPPEEVVQSLQIPEGGALESPGSLRRPDSDLGEAGGSSSYVPSLCSPTTRDSLDEGYDPDETLKIVVYDNEAIKISSSGMYHDHYSEEEEEDDDDQDVVYLSSRSSRSASTQNLNIRNGANGDDDDDVVYISSTSTSHINTENDNSRRVSTDANANNVQAQQDQAQAEAERQRDIVQLHLSYEDSQDVELYPFIIPANLRRQPNLEEQSREQSIDALEQIDSDIVEIEPNKFTIVRDHDTENGNDEKIKLMNIKSKIDYGDWDKYASNESNIKVCNDILNSINFDEISLTSLRKLRHSHLKLQKMSKIDSLDSDNKVFSEIWNAVKQDKFNGSLTENGGSDSDQAVFNTLNKSLSLESGGTTNSLFGNRMKAIPEHADSSMSSKDSFALPENPVPSPVYYPAATGLPDDVTGGPDSGSGSASKAQGASDKSILALREWCSSRQQKCSCDVMLHIFKYYLLLFSLHIILIFINQIIFIQILSKRFRKN